MEKIEFVGGPADGETLEITAGATTWHVEDTGAAAKVTYRRVLRQFPDAEGNLLGTEYMVAEGREDESR